MSDHILFSRIKDVCVVHKEWTKGYFNLTVNHVNSLKAIVWFSVIARCTVPIMYNAQPHNEHIVYDKAVTN